MSDKLEGLIFQLNGIMQDRLAWTQKYFDGKRDVYEVAGYPRNLTEADYMIRYGRQDIAKRLIDIFADESWRSAPALQDTEGVEESAFESAWTSLAASSATEDGDTQAGAAHYLQRLDKAAALGRYGVLLLGLKDGRKPSEPVRPGSLSDPSDLIYLSVFDEWSAEIATWETDPSSRRYRRPVLYNLKQDGAGPSQSSTLSAHWSRVIHVAEGALTSDVYGTPRLQAVINRLIDLEKVLAATGEGGWMAMQPGFVLGTRDGYRLPWADPSMPDDMRAALQEQASDQESQIDEFVHGLRRWLALDGMEATQLTGEMGDPSAAVMAFLQMISAATGIPWRILAGSEAAQLASEQDEGNFAKVIESRRANYCDPFMVRPLVNRLVWAGALPAPAGGKYETIWQPLIAAGPVETMDVADKAATALQKIGAKVDPKAFIAQFIPDLPEDAVEEKPDPVIAAPVGPGGDSQGNGAGIGGKTQTDPATGDSGQSSDERGVTNRAEFLRRWASYP